MTDINRQDLAKFYSIVPDMSILNPSLDWDRIKDVFEEKEHIVIESLLDEDVAADVQPHVLVQVALALLDLFLALRDEFKVTVRWVPEGLPHRLRVQGAVATRSWRRD